MSWPTWLLSHKVSVPDRVFTQPRFGVWIVYQNVFWPTLLVSPRFSPDPLTPSYLVPFRSFRSLILTFAEGEYCAWPGTAHCPSWYRNCCALKERLRRAVHLPMAYPLLARMFEEDADWIDRIGCAAGICQEAFQLVGRDCPAHLPYHPYLSPVGTPESDSGPGSVELPQAIQRRISLEEGVQPDYDADPHAPKVWYLPSSGRVNMPRVALADRLIPRRIPVGPTYEVWMDGLSTLDDVASGVPLAEPWHSAVVHLLDHGQPRWGTHLELGIRAGGVDPQVRAEAPADVDSHVVSSAPSGRPDPPGFLLPGDSRGRQEPAEARAGTPLDSLRTYQDGTGGYTGVHRHLTPLLRPVYITVHGRTAVWGLPWEGKEEEVYPVYCNAREPNHWYVLQPAFGWQNVHREDYHESHPPAPVGHSCAPPGVQVSTLYAVWHGNLGDLPTYDRDSYQMLQNGLIIVSADPTELLPSTLCPLMAESPTAWENRLYGFPLRFRPFGLPLTGADLAGKSLNLKLCT